MARKNMKSALSNSLKAEDEAVRSRFEKAEGIFGRASGNSSDDSESEGKTPEDDNSSQKTKVIRDSFTLPSDDYELINAMKQRCLYLAVNVTKSEVIRAGLHALGHLNDSELLQVFDGLEKVKTGRPSKQK